MIQRIFLIRDQIVRQLLYSTLTLEIPEFCQLILLTLGQLQIIFMLDKPIMFENQQRFDFVSSLQIFVLPNLGDLYFLPLLVIICLDLLPLIYLYLNKEQIIKNVSQFYTVYSYISYHYMLLPLSLISVRHLHTNLLISIISLLFTLIGALFKRKMYFLAFNMKPNSLQVLNQDLLEAINLVFLILMLIVYYSIQDLYIGLGIQSTIVTLLMLVRLNTLFKLFIVNHYQIQITILTISTGLCVAVITIFTLINLDWNHLTMSILIIPLIHYLINNTFMRYEIKVLRQLDNPQNQEQIIYYFSKYFKKQFYEYSQRLQIIEIIQKIFAQSISIHKINDLESIEQLRDFHQFLLKSYKSKTIKTEESLQYIALLLQLDQHYQALMQVNKLLNQYKNILNQQLHYNIIKAQIIKVEILKNYQMSFLQNAEKNILNEEINVYLKIDKQSNEIIEELINVLKQKLKLYNGLLGSEYKGFNVFEEAKQMVITLLKLENYLELQFKQHPNFNNRALLSFFQSEIQNNHYQAFKSYNYSTFQENTINSSLFRQNIFDQDTIYICFKFRIDKLIFLDSSKGISEFFRLKKDSNFILMENFDLLIPEILRKDHNKLIINFLNSTNSTYFLKNNQIFYQTDQYIMEPCQFLFNIDFLDNDIRFNAFFTHMELSNSFMMVDDVNMLLINISTQLLPILNKLQYFRIAILQLIPDYLQIPHGRISFVEMFLCNGQVYQMNVLKHQRQQLHIQYSTLEIIDMQQKQSVQKYDLDDFSEILVPNDFNTPFTLVEEIFIPQPQILATNRSQMINHLVENSVTPQSCGSPHQDNYMQESQSTHVQGIKSSLFYKKYLLIDRLWKLKNNPSSLQVLIILLIFQLVIGIIYFDLVLILQTPQLNRIVEEIDMIQLHSGFMGPHDNFLAMRVAIVTYQSFLSQKAINKSLYDTLTDPLYNNIFVGYYGMKDNFVDRLQNPNLQQFFTNQNITIIFMRENATIVYPMSLNIREALQIMLQYFYQFKILFEQRLSPANKPFQVFQAANIFNLHYYLEEVTQEIYQFSKNRSLQIHHTWNIVWIIFLIMSLLVILLGVYYLMRYYNIYQNYMNLFKSCSQFRLQREIDQCQYLIQELEDNKEYLFHFEFDLKQQEQFLLEELKHYESQKNKDYKQQSHSKKVKKYSQIVYYFSLWVLFSGVSTYLNQSTYSELMKYSATVDLYKFIQDMQYTSGALYIYRDFKYLWKNFSYLTELDEYRIYDTIQKGKDNILLFNQLYSTFNPNLYQISNEFSKFFADIQSQPICDLIDDLGFLEMYCNISLEGNLKRGLISTLQFMWKQIETEQIINNFTIRLEYKYYENEGALIVMKTFQTMTKKLKSNMVAVNSSWIQISQIIQITYIIFAVISILYILFIFKKNIELEIHYVRKFVQLMPLGSLLLDDSFERQLRRLLQQQQ